jgi:hypothetical protein
MKLPRGVSGDHLTRTLEHLGYAEIRQKGSHVRLRHQGPPARFTESSLRCPDAVQTIESLVELL